MWRKMIRAKRTQRRSVRKLAARIKFASSVTAIGSTGIVAVQKVIHQHLVIYLKIIFYTHLKIFITPFSPLPIPNCAIVFRNRNKFILCWWCTVYWKLNWSKSDNVIFQEFHPKTRRNAAKTLPHIHRPEGKTEIVSGRTRMRHGIKMPVDRAGGMRTGTERYHLLFYNFILLFLRFFSIYSYSLIVWWFCVVYSLDVVM